MQHHEPRLENGLLFVVIVGHSTAQIPSVQGQSQYNVVFKQYLSSRQLEGSPVDANPAKSAHTALAVKACLLGCKQLH